MPKRPEFHFKLDQKYIVPLSIALVILVSMLVSGYFIYQYFSLKNSLISGQTASAAEVKALVEKVGRIYELPKGEVPTVATVTDPIQLKSQPFFERAKVGDKVLVYLNARRGILYRPDSNKIINVSPININRQAVSPTPNQFQHAQDETLRPGSGQAGLVAGQQTKVVRVALYNGTSTSGIATLFEKDLKEKVTDVQFNVVSKSNANQGNYKLTKVIDLKGNLDEQVLKIAAALNGENARLPEGEKRPAEDVDILIIIGNDYTKTAAPTSAPEQPPAVEEVTPQEPAGP